MIRKSNEYDPARSAYMHNLRKLCREIRQCSGVELVPFVVDGARSIRSLEAYMEQTYKRPAASITKILGDPDYIQTLAESLR